jgi:hypothetical protein
MAAMAAPGSQVICSQPNNNIDSRQNHGQQQPSVYLLECHEKKIVGNHGGNMSLDSVIICPISCSDPGEKNLSFYDAPESWHVLCCKIFNNFIQCNVSFFIQC